MISIFEMELKRSIWRGLIIWGVMSLFLNSINLFTEYYWPFFSGIYIWILGLIMLIIESTLHLSYDGLFVLGTIAVVIIDSVVGGLMGLVLGVVFKDRLSRYISASILVIMFIIYWYISAFAFKISFENIQV